MAKATRADLRVDNLLNGESLHSLMLSVFLGEHGKAGGEAGQGDAGAGGCLPQSRSECQVKMLGIY